MAEDASQVDSLMPALFLEIVKLSGIPVVDERTDGPSVDGGGPVESPG